MQNMSINIKFEVKKIIVNKDNGFTVASVKMIEHPQDVRIPTADLKIQGVFYSIKERDTFSATGQWVDTGKNGYQFKVLCSEKIIPESNKGLADFLTRNIKGVGKSTAQKIVEMFKEDTLNVIRNNPEELLRINGITEKKARTIQEEIIKNKEYEEIVVYLLPLGLSMTQISKIYEVYKGNATYAVKENPYKLCKDDEISFKVADLVARNLDISRNDPRRIQQGIIELISYNLNNMGNLFVYKSDMYKDLPNFLNKYGSFTEKVDINSEDIDKYLNKLCTSGNVKIEDNDKVYAKFYLDMENGIVSMVEDMVLGYVKPLASNKNVDKFIKEEELKTGYKLANNQKEAINMAVNNRISILSGGPGTGKTYTVSTIIKCIKHIKPMANIELTAPTGKAAKRMTELTGMEAQTIHRLIGLNPLEENIELKPILSDFLIVDEASMVDAYVFYSLLSCISENTRILIVGDNEQLPSVGPGLILRDLINSNIVPTIILNEIFRQAKDSQIVYNSHRIIEGKKDISIDHTKKDFYFLETDEVTIIKSTIMKSIERLLETGFLLDDIQVLSVMNKGDLGVIELNRAIQERFNPIGDEVEISPTRIFRKNDKVMQTENNYDLSVFNGETGKIISINTVNNKDLELVVDFGDKEIIYNIDTVAQLTLSYAITVHKSQGSEFSVVIMPFHSSLNLLLNRNIIYTGWTRAKERVVCIGDKDELNIGIDKIDNTIRNSQIKDKLINKVNIEELPF